VLRCLSFAAIAVACFISPVRAYDRVPGHVEFSGASPCAAVRRADFSRIVDAPTQVEDARVVEAGAAGPAYCSVQGYVSSSVGFELRLPIEKWNGKLLEVGCGGFCGVPNEVAFCAIHRGYACILTDLGHRGVEGGKWAYNNLQAQIDFGYRGAHVAALAGKAITEYYYRRAPSHSYFHGCSSGGQQALSEAQRYPEDFDGLIAGAPSPTFSGPMMNYAWAKKALLDGQGNPVLTRAELEFVHAAVLKKCAIGDAGRRGFLSDPQGCQFDPAELQCSSEQHGQCLSAAQIEAVRKVYSGPTTSRHTKIYTGGPMLGSELNWIDGEAAPYVYSDGSETWPEEYFAYIGFTPAPGAGWKYTDFDFDRDYKRLATTEALFGAADNPDLRKFKAAGGKLILYQGWNDQSDIPTDSIDYYETTEKTMGGREPTVEFFRMFLVPGMDHCSGGPGPFAIDYLTYLEAWVEQGRAPDKLIGAHLKGINWSAAFKLKFPLDPATPVSFTRPIYPYPLIATYGAKGNPDDAASFIPIAPARLTRHPTVN
jgi:hypothetical protein